MGDKPKMCGYDVNETRMREDKREVGRAADRGNHPGGTPGFPSCVRKDDTYMHKSQLFHITQGATSDTSQSCGRGSRIRWSSDP